MENALPAAILVIGVAGAAIAVWGLLGPRTRRPDARRGGRPVSRRAFLLSALAASAVAILAAVRLFTRPPPPSPPPPSGSPSPGLRRPEGIGLWIPPDELAALATATPAFRRVLETSTDPIPEVDVCDQDSDAPGRIMQAALVAARIDDDLLRGRVRDAISAVIGTEGGDTGGHPPRNRALGIGRNLPSYVIAADVIGLRDFDASVDRDFRSWLDALRTERIDGVDAPLAELEPIDHSNWGAYIGAAMAAVNAYLDDRDGLRNSAEILKGWLGEPGGRHEWQYDTDRHDYSWECHYPDVNRYLPVNPKGCSRDGFTIDGIIPIDMQRGAGFEVPPEYTQYPRESLQGRTVQAELLHRAGFDSYAWGDAGLVRIAERLRALREFDEDWYEPTMGCYWILAARTGSRFPRETPSTGRGVAAVDWMLGADVEDRAPSPPS